MAVWNLISRRAFSDNIACGGEINDVRDLLFFETPFFQMATKHFLHDQFSDCIDLCFPGTVTKREEGRTSMLHFEMLFSNARSS